MESKKGQKRKKIDGLNQHRLETIGSFLRKYRQNESLSRRKLANEIGISKGVIERLENGSGINLSYLLLVIDGLMLSPHSVFEGVE